MKIKNRIISILLVAMMVLAMLPISAFTVFAEEPAITEVSTFSELLEAVNSDKEHIKLTKDIEDVVPDDELPTKHRLVFDGGKNYLLDLNGYTLKVINHANEYYTGKVPMISVSGTSTLEIKDGSLGFDNWYAGNDRKARGVVHVADTSTLVATKVNMQNKYAGNVVSATADAKVTLDGGEYTVQNGFAIYLDRQASLTLDGDVSIQTVVGDSANTQSINGYGALYSESTGELIVNYAFFKSGIQVSKSQIGAFSTANHEVTINGKVLTEDIFVGTSTEAKNQNKEYFWYSYTQNELERTSDNSFSNVVRVISYDKKYPIDVQSGIAMINGNPVTEASYGQTVTLVAHTPEEGMEFVRWDTSGVVLANYYNATTTFTMLPAPVYFAAYYGKESVKSVSLTVDAPVIGQKISEAKINVEGDTLEAVEWFENVVLVNETDIFKPGKTYTIKVLLYPPDEHMFADEVSATVNGNSASIDANTQYAYVDYEVGTLAENAFPVIYNASTAKLGVGGLLELDTALMASQSAEFKSALDAGTVKYQWYKNSEPIEGETDAVYHFTVDDIDSRFFVTVTVGDKVAWGDTHGVYNYLYQVYLNAGEYVAGGKAPQMSSATPGVGIIQNTMWISEGYGQETLDVEKMVLIPGKSYVLSAQLAEIGEAIVPYGANVHVNGELMPKEIDGLGRFFYEFTVPEADYPVYYKENGEIGIGVTLSVDIEKMCNESATFKHAYEVANPTYQTVFYQWYKNGEIIEGATSESYTVKTTDRDSLINCKVTLVDGKYGIGEQYAISNVITVINLNIAHPQDGKTRIEASQITADGVTVTGIMWMPTETGVVMQGTDVYTEGVSYDFYIQLEANDTFLLDFNGDMTIMYAYGEKVPDAGSVPNQGKASYYGEVVAIHKHIYSADTLSYDSEGHWQSCMVSGCIAPNEEKNEYAEHSGGSANCQQKAVCDVCKQAYGEFGNHIAKAEWKNDAENHWHECSLCEGQELEKSAHADTNNDEKCDACSYAMPKAEENDPSAPTPDVPNTNTDKPTDATDKPTDATESEKDDSTETEKKNGCGSTLALSSLAIVALVGSALVIKKKED